MDKKLKCLVIGETCLDRFVQGSVAQRVNPESPSLIFTPKRETSNAGMAGNVRANLVFFNCEVDGFFNADKEHVITKTRFVDETSGFILFRLDENDSVERINFKSSKLIGKLKEYDFVVVSDYNKGFLLEEDMKRIFAHHPYCFLDTKKILGSWADKAKFIKINEREYNLNLVRSNYLKGESQTRLIVTLGAKGSRYLEKYVPTKEAEIRNVCGCGDTFLAAFASHFMSHTHTPDYCISKSMKYANLYATEAAKHSGVVSSFMAVDLE